MDINDIELLLSLHNLPNITKVSQKLFVSQSAITKRIKKIEAELGIELLTRSKKGVTFTPIGESLIPYATQIYMTMQQMNTHILNSKDYIGGSLSIYCSLNIASYYLPNIVKIYSERYPLVDIRITSGSNENIYRMIQSDVNSIAFVRGEYPWPDEKVLLFSEPISFICSQSNVNRPLDSYPYIERHADPMFIADVNEYFKENDISVSNKNFFINTVVGCKEMVLNGVGWAVVPQLCLSDFDGYIENLYFKNGTPLKRKTYLFYRKEQLLQPQIKLFVDLITQHDKGSHMIRYPYIGQ